MLYEAMHITISNTHRPQPPKLDKISTNKVTKDKDRQLMCANNKANSNGVPHKQTSMPPLNTIMNNIKQTELLRSGSFVVGQKLRESKWFNHTELKILCAVCETGFIVELKSDNSENTEESDFGVAVWNDGYEKSKDPSHLNICTLQRHKDNYRTITINLLEFWNEDARIRINNYSDKSDKPLESLQIRNQLEYAQKAKRKWHNIGHLTYLCRYGPVCEIKRTKNVSEKFNDIQESFRKIRQKFYSLKSNNSDSSN